MKITKESQWSPFGGSIRYENEGEEEYRIRLLKGKESEIIRNDNLISSWHQGKLTLDILKRKVEESNSILEHIDSELEKLKT